VADGTVPAQLDPAAVAALEPRGLGVRLGVVPDHVQLDARGGKELGELGKEWGEGGLSACGAEVVNAQGPMMLAPSAATAAAIVAATAAVVAPLRAVAPSLEHSRALKRMVDRQREGEEDRDGRVGRDPPVLVVLCP
jgi:hypothetical protein